MTAAALPTPTNFVIRDMVLRPLSCSSFLTVTGALGLHLDGRGTQAPDCAGECTSRLSRACLAAVNHRRLSWRASLGGDGVVHACATGLVRRQFDERAAQVGGTRTPDQPSSAGAPTPRR